MSDPLRRRGRSRARLAFARLWDSRRFRAIVWAQVIGGFIALLWIQGGLQPFELLIYDGLRVAWAGSAPSNTVLLVGGTDADVEDFDWPLKDGDLADLLERIASWHPRIIGVDIYRDRPRPPGTERLAAVLARHKEIVWTLKLPDGVKRGIPPPADLRGTDRGVLADIVTDSGNVVRRGFLYADDGVDNYASMGMALALGYLAVDGIRLAPADDDQLRLGKALIAPLDNSRGPYIRLDSAGYQVLLDYQGGPHRFPFKSIGEILHGDDAASLVRGRAVLIGVTSESVKDTFPTPFGTGFGREEPIWGITVHAQIADQLIREALNGDPIVGGMPRRYEALFIWFWAVAGALVGATLHTQLRVASAAVAGICILGAIVYGSFGLALWLPAVPAAMVWTAGLGGPASWEVGMTSRLQRQARVLRRVRLLASGRQLLLLALTQQASGADATDGTDYRTEVLRELVATLAAIDPSKANWTDG